MRRDRAISKELKNDEWRVLRVWEHSLKKSPDSVAKKVERLLAS